MQCDTLRHYTSFETKHFVVFCRGVYYTVPIYGAYKPGSHRHVAVKAAQLQVAFEAIMAASEGKDMGNVGIAASLAALTTTERTWAAAA